LYIFVRAAKILQEPARLLQHLFYFIADIRNAINGAIYFIAASILFDCT